MIHYQTQSGTALKLEPAVFEQLARHAVEDVKGVRLIAPSKNSFFGKKTPVQITQVNNAVTLTIRVNVQCADGDNVSALLENAKTVIQQHFKSHFSDLSTMNVVLISDNVEFIGNEKTPETENHELT